MLVQALTDEDAPRRMHSQDHPKGWEPSIVFDGTKGEISTGPLEHEPDDQVWTELIADWNLDPRRVRIVPGSVQFRGWDANVGKGNIKRLRYYRATIEPRSASLLDSKDVDELMARVAKLKPRIPAAPDIADGAFVLVLSDWQVGKGEGGGTPAFLDRLEEHLGRVLAYLKDLKRSHQLPALAYVVGLGDLVEQCDGHYAMQAFQTDLDRRDQCKLARRTVLRWIDLLLGFFDRIVCAAVPGNHGENRRDGKAFTSFHDNDDLATFETVAEILSANPDRYGRVTVVLPESPEMTMTLDVAGVAVGMAHSHQAKSSGPGAVLDWWKSQALGRRPVADASILLTGHFHHLVVNESVGRTWIQAPANDGGSQWFAETNGAGAPPGQLVACVGSAYGSRGWDHLRVL